MSQDEFVGAVSTLLDEIHEVLYKRSYDFMESRIKKIETLEAFESFFSEKSKENGFAYVHWNEEAIDHPVLKKLKVTPRCIPLEEGGLSGTFEEGTCIFSGKPSCQRVFFAKAY